MECSNQLELVEVETAVAEVPPKMALSSEQISDYLRRGRISNSVFRKKTKGPFAEDYETTVPDEQGMAVAEKLFRNPLESMQPVEEPEPEPQQMEVLPKENTTFSSSYTRRTASDEDARNAIAEHIPVKSDYKKPGIGRKILGVLAGIGRGYLQGPEMGFHTADRVINKDYYKGKEDYERRMGQIFSKNKFERDTEKFENDQALTGARTGSEYERAGAERSRKQAEALRGGKYLWDMQQPRKWEPESKQDVIDIENIRHPNVEKTQKLEDFQLELENGQKVWAKRNSDGTFTNLTDNTVISGGVKSATPAARLDRPNESNTGIELRRDAWLRANPGKTINDMTEADAQRISQSPMNPIVVQNMQESIRGRQLDNRLQASEQSDTSINNYLDIIGSNPDQFHDIPTKFQGMVKDAAMAKGIRIPKKLDVREKDMDTKADLSLSHIESARQLIRNLDPTVKGRLGAFAGRFEEGLIKLGNDPTLNGNQKTQVMELYAALSYLKSWEAAVQSGSRGATDNVRKAVEDISAKITQDPSIMEGAFRAAELTAKQVKDRVNKIRYGSAGPGNSGEGNSLRKLMEEINNAKRR